METLRRHSSVTFVSGRLLTNVAIGGKNLEKGAKVKANLLHAVRTDETVFSNPEDFSWERWRGPEAVQKQHPELTSLIFAGGLGAAGRGCPGKDLSLLLLENIVSTILEHASFVGTSEVKWEKKKYDNAGLPVELEVSCFKASDEVQDKWGHNSENKKLDISFWRQPESFPN
jgi:cytochrome P450